MTAPDPRLGEIEGRSGRALLHESLNASDYADMAWESARDVPYLLAELRKAQDALGRVSRIVNGPDWEGFPPFRVDAEPIRAAVAAAGGGGE